jgi:MOSC domain-containing protein YiiM
MAKIVSINISEKRGTFKFPVASASLKRDHGIEGDSHADNWHRQISLLAQESIDKMTAMGVPELTPGKFAENITTEGIELFTLPVGTRLTLGGCEVEVTQIGKECHHHCEIFHKVGKCVMPLEGIFVKVLTEGAITPGDSISVMDARTDG